MNDECKEICQFQSKLNGLCITLHKCFFAIILVVQSVEIVKYSILYWGYQLYQESKIQYKQDPSNRSTQLMNFFFMPELFSISNNDIFIA